MNDDRISKHIEFKDSLKAYKEYLSNCCSGSFIRSHSWFDGIDMKVKKKKNNEVIVVN